MCNSCLKEKNLSEFNKDKSGKDGYRGKCRDCTKNTEPAFIKPRVLTGELAVCKACNLEKDTCYFSFNKKRNKLHSKCIDCSRKGVPIIKERISEKVCKSCGIMKAIENFYEVRENNYFSSCKKCTSEVKKTKDYYNQYKKNKGRIKAYKRKRRAENPLISLKDSISSSILRGFKQCDLTKNERTLKILSCTIEEFKKHIESQFLNWMNWSNYGNICGTELQYNCSWDLDHIIPISSAKTEEEVYLLNHWSNFQPLCSKINRDVKKANIYPCSNLELKITIKDNQIIKT